MTSSRPVLIAGAGIAGLTAALALTRHEVPVRIFERASHLLEIGAGLQISPNACHVLQQIGVFDRLDAAAIRPEAIVMADSDTGRTLAELPLGKWAEQRWGAPYLVAHRADLQKALLDTVREHRSIELEMSAEAVDAQTTEKGVLVTLAGRDRSEIEKGRVLLAADGVWSALRQSVPGHSECKFTGFIACRATLPASSRAARHFDPACVTVYVHRSFHLVAYPLRGGALINLVVVVRGNPIARQWEASSDAGQPELALAGTSIDDVAKATTWSAWPIYCVPASGKWTSTTGIALLGDAAHAMTPFAAQGASMAIEDAAVLANCLAQSAAGDEPRAISRYEVLRKPRIVRVARRSRFNQAAWHARGPTALLRNFILEQGNGRRLMEKLDWLYGYRA